MTKNNRIFLKINLALEVEVVVVVGANVVGLSVVSGGVENVSELGV